MVHRYSICTIAVSGRHARIDVELYFFVCGHSIGHPAGQFQHFGEVADVRSQTKFCTTLAGPIHPVYALDQSAGWVQPYLLLRSE